MAESGFVKKSKNQYVKMMDVPIYHVMLYVVIAKSDDLEKIRSEDYFVKKFGPLKKKKKKFSGLVSSNEGSFGIFLPIEFDIGIIAHEIFHLTHKILEYHNVKFEHESFALFHEYLFNVVYDFYKSKKVYKL